MGKYSANIHNLLSRKYAIVLTGQKWYQASKPQCSRWRNIHIEKFTNRKKVKILLNVK